MEEAACTVCMNRGRVVCRYLFSLSGRILLSRKECKKSGQKSTGLHHSLVEQRQKKIQRKQFGQHAQPHVYCGTKWSERTPHASAYPQRGATGGDTDSWTYSWRCLERELSGTVKKTSERWPGSLISPKTKRKDAVFSRLSHGGLSTYTVRKRRSFRRHASPSI